MLSAATADADIIINVDAVNKEIFFTGSGLTVTTGLSGRIAWNANAAFDISADAILTPIAPTGIVISGLTDNTPGALNQVRLFSATDRFTLAFGGVSGNALATLTPQGSAARISYGGLSAGAQSALELTTINATTFSLTNGSGASGAVQFAHTSVPEPTAVIPLGLAAIGFVTTRRLKRKRSDSAAA